ncbi:MAG: 23S rRNA (uracil(1939)-C(5))-methyltransferase RlmD [candidate division FCPU426 bacterium]
MNPEKPLTLTVESLAYGGDGVAHLEDGRAVFVSGAAPGDQVQAELTLSKKTYAKARLTKVLTPSPSRVAAPCPVADTCGGCQWQHLSYAAQLEAKQNFVLESLRRIGGFEDPPLKHIIACDQPFQYRNKAIVPAWSGRFGFYGEASHDIVELPESGCAVQSAAGNRVLVFIRSRVKNLPGLRHVVVRSNSRGEVLLALVSFAALKGLETEAEAWIKALPSLLGVVNNIQPRDNNVIFGPETRVLAGEENLEEDLGGFKFRLSAASFFQVNPGQTVRLWEMLAQVRSWTGREKVLELYCGVGTLSLSLAKRCARLLGVESFGPAVEDAKKNALLNACGNARFEEGDALRGFELMKDPDLLVVDPPRKGLDPAVVQAILKQRPPELLYVSCDPASLARDLKALAAGGYVLDQVQPLDMFPQTYHVECLARMRLA